LTFYFATSLVPRDWKRPPMGKLGWTLAVSYILLFSLLVFRNSPELIRGPGVGYLVSILFFFTGLLYLFRTLGESQQSPYRAESFMFLKCAAYGTVVVFILLGTLVATAQGLSQGSNLNLTAMRLSVGWTIVVFLLVLGHYWRNRC